MELSGKTLLDKSDMATIKTVATSLDSDIICYTGKIAYPWDCAFVERIRKLKRRKNALLIMTTGGGSPDAGYRMMRLLQHYYSTGKISFLVIDQCKSTGTLVAVGANEIILADDAELGPLDIQLPTPDEIFEYTSGLAAYQALTALRNEVYQSFEDHFLRLRRASGLQITTRTAADIAAKLSTGGIQKLYEQLDPIRLAEHQRAMTIAEYYGTRLNRGNLKVSGEFNALDQLIAGYPDHGFLIDFAEAKLLFNRVRLPSANELKLCYLLLELGICSLPRAARSPIILVITEDYKARPADNKKGSSNANTVRKTSKATTKTSTNRLPPVRIGDAKLNGKNGRSAR